MNLRPTWKGCVCTSDWRGMDPCPHALGAQCILDVDRQIYCCGQRIGSNSMQSSSSVEPPLSRYHPVDGSHCALELEEGRKQAVTKSRCGSLF